jgi:hypothetical protein
VADLGALMKGGSVGVSDPGAAPAGGASSITPLSYVVMVGGQSYTTQPIQYLPAGGSVYALVRMHEFWDAMVTRLKGSAALIAVLGGPRVYKVTDEFGTPEEPTDQKPWGRAVIVPSNTLWAQPDYPGQTKTVSWLIRIDFSASGYSVDVSMDAALAAVDAQLSGWLPSGLAFTHVLVAVPIYRYTSPRALAEWNEQNGVWWKSVEYRTEVSPL